MDVEVDVRQAQPRTGRRRSFETGRLVAGPVEHGDERGRALGFPTANLAIDDPGVRDGVWAATVELEDGRLVPSCVSIGRRPTFYARDGVRLLEAYLLDFSGDLYGRQLRVWLDHRLRLQKRFASVESLCAQMQSDVDDTRRWAATAPWFVVRSPGWRRGHTSTRGGS
ncbi:MAG: riboflavin kinase [Nocardioides sp.]|uniref:riboflavin kinase n=1 Tax=Nocardioides sp. TaxID=35761 RepID=UPI0039E60C47